MSYSRYRMETRYKDPGRSRDGPVGISASIGDPAKMKRNMLRPYLNGEPPCR